MHFKQLVLNIPSYSFILDGIAFIALIVSSSISTFWWYYIIATFAMALIFIASIPENSIWGRITRNKLLMRFGVYCYSIYLFHIPLLTALEPLKDWLFLKIGIVNAMVEIKVLVWFPFVALISFFLAFFTFNLIEKPCVNLGKKLIPKINEMISNATNRRTA